jgi:ankyrin repeat protein
MMRVRLDLETLTTVTSRGSQDSTIIRNEVVNGLEQQQENIMAALTQNYHQVDDRISRLEKMLSAQSASIEATQLAKIGSLYSTNPPRLRKQMPRRTGDDGPPLSPVRAEGLVVRGTQYINTGCQSGCICACHSQGRTNSPGLVDRVLGQLFVGYAGLPLFSPQCDAESCEKHQSTQVSVEYWFPLGFCWSQIIRLQLGYHSQFGPQMTLSTLRRVPDSAQCVNYALEGNIVGLKSLFKNGLASPRDVSSTRGYSVLRWALYGQQYETCKFLIAAGADPGYRPISLHDNSPSDKACDIILRGNLSREVLEILKLMSQESDFVESQNFAPIHKIVLGLSLQDLEQEILKDPEAVDLLDGTGRSALEWAAARGDERSVITLLSYGADPNITDKNLNTPLTLASNQNHTGCVRLLVEAGALPDPPLPAGVKFGSPLNCAARNASDPLLLKTLLDFNANIEAMGVDRITPLLHVARSNSASHAMLLLEYGANINAISKDGRTPLTTAISYNNHSVLKLLLDRWFEYSECPRLKGPHLLDLVAQYADLETMTILTTSEHLKLKYDKDYVLQEATAILKKRQNLTEKLTTAFEELLDVLRHPGGLQKSRDNLLETGTLTLTRSISNSSGDSELSRAFSITGLNSDPVDDDGGSDQEFEDAQESLALASDEIPIFVSPFEIQSSKEDDQLATDVTISYITGT